MKNKRIDSLDYRYTKLYIHFYCVSDNNEMYKFWMYYFGSPDNVGQDPPVTTTQFYPFKFIHSFLSSPFFNPNTTL